MPDEFDHGSNLKLVGTAGFGLPKPYKMGAPSKMFAIANCNHLRPRGPKPRALKTELRSEKMADPKGLAPSAFPQTTGCSSD
jgi:hypothetical protein